MKEQLFSEECRGILDVTKPPYCVDNTGCKDCTEQLRQILNDLLQRQIDGVKDVYKKLEEQVGDVIIGFENRKINGEVTALFPEFCDPTPTIYFPNGTYLVSDTISYTLTELHNFCPSQTATGYELNRHIRLLGQSREGVVLRLQDNCKGFEFGQSRPVITFMQGERSNVAMSNYIENLTIDTGKGNPGAVGLVFFANNNGAVRSVTIQSGDPTHCGSIGLGILHEIVSGCYVRDVLVDGFSYGIKVIPTRNFTVFEDVTVRHQILYGMAVEQTITSIRKFTSENTVTGLFVGGASAHVVLTDGVFSCPEGIKANVPAVRVDLGCAFVRHITTKGYQLAVSRFWGEESCPDGFVEEYSTHGSYHLYPDQNTKSLNLPVEPFPDARPVTDLSRWACAEAFGTKGDGVTDDTDALQAAMNSGYPVIWLQPGRYRLSRPVTIPATVEHVHCMYSDFALDEALVNAHGESVFRIVGETDKPLVIEKILAWEQCHGFVRFLRQDNTRTLYAKDILTQTCAFYFNTVPGGKVFLENVACTSGNVKYRGLPAFEFHGKTAWGHLMNPERAEIEVLNDGGTFWLMGFKTEGDGPLVDTRDGGYSEVLGGVMSIGRNHLKPIVLNTDSNVSVICSTNSYGTRSVYPLAVSDIRKGQERHLFSSSLPLRLYPFCLLPLYTGYAGPKKKESESLYNLY